MSEEIKSEEGVFGGNTFKTQIDAVYFLQDRGYKVTKSTFNRDYKAKKISTLPDGTFCELALLAYAKALRETTQKHEDKELLDANKNRTAHDARLKEYQADRLQIKLQKEKGEVISRVEHEQDLSLRASFFKKEVENFIHLRGAGIIYLVNGDESKLAALVEHWEDITSDWMNAWAQDREFLIKEYEEEE